MSQSKSQPYAIISKESHLKPSDSQTENKKVRFARQMQKKTKTGFEFSTRHSLNQTEALDTEGYFILI